MSSRASVQLMDDVEDSRGWPEPSGRHLSGQTEQGLTLEQMPRGRRKYSISRVRALELFASVFGLAGMYLGSTTLHGALCYAVGIPCLITCVYKRKLWGLLPLNLAQAIVIAINVFRAL